MQHFQNQKTQINIRHIAICIVTGFCSGLPLFVLVNLVQAWLSKSGLSLKALGLFSLVMFPYTWKFIWAPFMDRFAIGLLGRRRGWMLLTQIALLVSMASVGMLNPVDSPFSVASICFIIAFLSASQDIVLDAFRRELLPDVEQGLGSAVFVNAYKISGMVPGALALVLADHLPWTTVFFITSLFMIPGIICTIFVKEPVNLASAPQTIRSAIIDPFVEFISRSGYKQAIIVLAFILAYKLGDSMATALATKFYLDLGFTMTQVGLVAKSTGLWASIIGGILGGVWMLKIGINKGLWVFGAAQAFAILGFYVISIIPPTTSALAVVIGLEAFTVGLGTTALVAFIARTTEPKFAATQFALFTSLAAVPRTMINAFTGFIVEQLGWSNFYLLCFALALPGMLLLVKVAPWSVESQENISS